MKSLLNIQCFCCKLWLLLDVVWRWVFIWTPRSLGVFCLLKWWFKNKPHHTEPCCYSQGWVTRWWPNKGNKALRPTLKTTAFIQIRFVFTFPGTQRDEKINCTCLVSQNEHISQTNPEMHWVLWEYVIILLFNRKEGKFSFFFFFFFGPLFFSYSFSFLLFPG